jgi:hypothetical protein
LIKRLSIYLDDTEIEVLANEMRSKRNRDLYGGGAFISQKEIQEYIQWIKKIFERADIIIKKQPKLRLE